MKINDYTITDKYVIFLNSFLSNWYPCEIVYNNIKFHSSEQLFMYLKAMTFDDTNMMEKIKNCNGPGEAKQYGRRVKPFHPLLWEQKREDCMRVALVAKFKQNPKLKEILLSPEWEGKHFVEGNPYDDIWGVGLHYKDDKAKDNANWRGLNLLGKSLDIVRYILSEQDRHGYGKDVGDLFK